MNNNFWYSTVDISMSSPTKWKCDYCTFHNWPSASKCTMCRSLKPLRLISPTTSKADLFLDQKSELPVCIVSQQESNKNKWSCHDCTYMNWPKAAKCSQCQAAKPPDPVSKVNAENIHDLIRPLRIEATPSPPRLSPTPSCNKAPSPEAEICNSRSNSPQASCKWKCEVCTYENWPKSPHCAMCHSNPPIAPVRNNSNENIYFSALNQQTTSSHGRIPLSRSGSANNYEVEKRLRQLRRQHREADWTWLNAIQGVIEGNVTPIASYLNAGGDPLRHLSNSDVTILPRYAGVDQGQSLVQIALRYQNEEVLKTILSAIQGTKGTKRTPHHIAPELATDIRKYLSGTLRHHKAGLPCVYFLEMSTFAIPQEVADLPPLVQSQLYEELLDQDVQKELENDCCAINWSRELTLTLGTRLLALWNRTAGDCLLDSVLEATWGILDRDGLMRKTLADCLHSSGHLLYERWAEYEIRTAAEMNLGYIPTEAELSSEWSDLVSRARRPGAPLDQLHIWALSHILRRPIVVYGATFVKSHVGEPLDYARFQGVYLPLLWEPSFCWKVPISLGYTRGHFSALVPVEPDDLPAGDIRPEDGVKSTYLPLITNDAQLLPVHFLMDGEIGQEELLLHQWLDVHLTEGGCLVARQRLGRRPLLVAQMVEEWLNHYRRIL